MQINASTPSFDQVPVLRAQNEKPVESKEPKTKIESTEETQKSFDKQENLEKLKTVLAESNITLKFSQDNDTKELVVKLVDNKTGEAIRQIPSEISLKLASIFVKMQGQFVDTKE